jgi:hypothetical protein
LIYDVCNPAQASSIFLSNIGEDFFSVFLSLSLSLSTVVVVVVDDGGSNNWRSVPELYKDTKYTSLYDNNDV